MTRLEFSDDARDDIFRITTFLAINHSFEKAHTTRQKILKQAKLLANMPYIGTPRPELIKGVYGFPCTPYLYLYWICSDGIELTRVLHMSRDIEGMISE